GGPGVGEGTAFVQHGDAEEVVRHGAAAGGVDGVHVATAVALEVVAVVARGREGQPIELDDTPYGALVGGRLFDADAERAASGVSAATTQLAADLDEVVVVTACLEQGRHAIDGMALGDGREVDLELGMELA